MTSPTESIICWQPDGGSAKRVHVALGDRGRTRSADSASTATRASRARVSE